MKAEHRGLREPLPPPTVVVVGDPGVRRRVGALLAAHGFGVVPA
jgi:hypothetical protein